MIYLVSISYCTEKERNNVRKPAN